MERYVDTREEGFVEYLDTIGGEEEDARIVLDVAETFFFFLKKNEKKWSENNFIVGT